ncbi:hypothetical protein CY0110_17862 [Crocosphaera chwakensis CCY0110]|uniref:Uncharacterized protein n=1 Tax=Crocosphaera chwakensis CCY0110 TaxID=391612 RepID=A3IIQ4_9CHRO|nr:hypothetical protein CY0110_17862 [Crocosphaera chwakensis CCY0110]
MRHLKSLPIGSSPYFVIPLGNFALLNS